jgi:23S rRNA pseudouridine955/2504/2580 synthase
MIKCFNSIKNCYHPRHDDYCPSDPGVQLLEVSPEYAGQRIDNFLLAGSKACPRP